MSDWHDLPEEMRERRPLPERIYWQIQEYETVEKVEEELQFALSELADGREEVEKAIRALEDQAMEVHALQLRLLELQNRRGS